MPEGERYAGGREVCRREEGYAGGNPSGWKEAQVDREKAQRAG